MLLDSVPGGAGLNSCTFNPTISEKVKTRGKNENYKYVAYHFSSTDDGRVYLEVSVKVKCVARVYKLGFAKA